MATAFKPGSKKQIIVDYVVGKVKSGEWAPGHELPLNKDLEVLFNAGRATVWEAKNHLERHGIINPGSGRWGPGGTGKHTTVADLAPYMI